MSLKKVIAFVIIFAIVCSVLFAQDKGKSVFDSSREVLNESKQVVDSTKSIINYSRSPIEKGKIIDDSKKILDESKTVLEIDNGGIGSYSYSYQNSTVSVKADIRENVYECVDQDSYVNGYDKYLETVVSKYPEARHNFVEYFSEWEKVDKDDDFFSYSINKAEYERSLELSYDKALKKFGAGTAIIATTWSVSFVLPGGSIYQVAMIIIAKATTKAAITGAVSGGVVSVTRGLITGNRGEKLWHETVDGAASGYLIGAVSGVVEGGIKVSKLAKESRSFGEAAEAKIIFDNKVYDANGDYLGRYLGKLEKINGRAVINEKLVNTVNENGIPYKYFLADDGAGNFFEVVNPDFTSVKIVGKVYRPPRSLWHDAEACKNWCRQEYLKDLADPNVTDILGISKKEATMRLQFEKGLDLRNNAFMKTNSLSKKEINIFLKTYDSGAWHHLPSSGELIYVPKNHGPLAPHTGGDSIWGSKSVVEDIEW